LPGSERKTLIEVSAKAGNATAVDVNAAKNAAALKCLKFMLSSKASQ
jgi:hypothetical protein